MFENTKWLAKAAYVALRRHKEDRQKNDVLQEYSNGWKSYSNYLEKCDSLEDWLLIKGLEDDSAFYQISGELKYQKFDIGRFNKQKILETLIREFPDATSITEYGCGIGRNLLFLKKQLPHLKCYGYELCLPGVELANAAAKKFGLDVQFSQLDYVNGLDSEYVFPNVDVTFTMFSLEQLPTSNKQALENILRHTNQGSIHLEPVVEKYPYTLRGLIGRIEHWKVDYLKNFDKNISSTNFKEVKAEVLHTSHNPLMFPTLYVLKKV